MILGIDKLTSSESISIRYLRAIATLLIVACHYLQSCECRWSSVLNIGVQLFFVMSGYLFGYQHIDNGSWFYKRWRKLFIPYIVFVGVLMFFLQMLSIQPIEFEEVIKYSFLCHGFLGSELKGAGHLWFITAIFVCYWITPVLQYITNSKYSSIISGILLLVLSFFSFLLFTKYDFSILWQYSWFFNYTAGYLLAKSHIKLKIFYFVVSILFIVLTMQVITWNDILQNNSVNMAFHAFGAHFVFLLFIFCSRLFELKRVIQPFDVIERYSLYVYLVHYPFTRTPWSLVGCTDSWVLNLLIIIAVIIVSAATLYIFSRHIGKVVDNIIPL